MKVLLNTPRSCACIYICGKLSRKGFAQFSPDTYASTRTHTHKHAQTQRPRAPTHAQTLAQMYEYGGGEWQARVSRVSREFDKNRQKTTFTTNNFFNNSLELFFYLQICLFLNSLPWSFARSWLAPTIGHKLRCCRPLNNWAHFMLRPHL